MTQFDVEHHKIRPGQKCSILLIIGVIVTTFVTGQQPKYTMKKFVNWEDSTLFKTITNANGFNREYTLSKGIVIWDLDDNHRTFIRGVIDALVCFEGQKKNGLQEGLVNVFLIDNNDYSKRYKIWEQTYLNGKLNGRWSEYTLSGTVYDFKTYTNDSLDGIAREFSIDGKTVVSETEYINGENKFIARTFFRNGTINFEVPYENGKMNGTGKEYYDNGKLKNITEFRDGQFDGVEKYYYPNGQLWIHQIYKNGKNWEVVANYTDKGVARNAGTLKNGNGTIIYYNEDGTIREVKTYVNGEEKLDK